MDKRTQDITVTVLNETVTSIMQNCQYTGLTPGELIDRVMLKFSPHEPNIAAQLILESISISIRELEEDDVNIALRTVLAVLHRTITMDGMKGLDDMIDRLEELFPEIDYELPDEFRLTDF